MVKLPPNIEHLVALIGYGPTMEMVREFGGLEIAIPRTEESATWAALAEVIGEPATRRLAADFVGCEKTYIAMCTDALRAARNQRIVARFDALLAEKHSARGAVSILVREFRPISYRTIEKIVNAPEPALAPAVQQACLF